MTKKNEHCQERAGCDWGFTGKLGQRLCEFGGHCPYGEKVAPPENLIANEHTGPIWRYFEGRQLEEAKAWADQGNIAIHRNEFAPGKEYAAHLLGKDDDALIEAAKTLGLKPSYLHQGSRNHFDLFGEPYSRAMVTCREHEDLWECSVHS